MWSITGYNYYAKMHSYINADLKTFQNIKQQWICCDSEQRIKVTAWDGNKENEHSNEEKSLREKKRQHLTDSLQVRKQAVLRAASLMKPSLL